MFMDDYSIVCATAGYILRKTPSRECGVYPDQWAFSTVDELTGWLNKELKERVTPARPA
jgi:hypothetical protein